MMKTAAALNDYFESAIARRENAPQREYAESCADAGRVLHIPVEKIAQNPYQPRKYFAAHELRELADSILEYGVLQPITVRLINNRNYELVAGERRLRASKLAGLAVIPAVLMEMSDKDSAVIALVENLQRKDLNFLEEAQGLSNLARDYGMTQEEIARRIGKTQSAVANKIRILRLPEPVKALVMEHGLMERQARSLLRLEMLKTGVENAQMECARRFIKDGMNVKQADEFTERYIEKRLGEEKPGAARTQAKAYINDIRVFENTIKNACDIMNSAGLSAVYKVERQEDGYYIGIMISSRK